jgi:hypothetical protein
MVGVIVHNYDVIHLALHLKTPSHSSKALDGGLDGSKTYTQVRAHRNHREEVLHVM